ncbi:RdRP-domain-containing protein [Hymenopellis radicata]|nr:RdRP-domain-containing protein [Hymenopellis radicata]
MDHRNRRPRPRHSEPSYGSSSRPVHAGVKRRNSDHFQPQRKRQRRDPGANVPAPIPFNIQRAPKDPLPGAVIALRGFDDEEPAPTNVSVQEALEQALETVRDHRGRVINFEVSVRPNPPAVAYVTLPYSYIYDHLLDERTPIIYDDRYLRMSLDRKEPNPMVLDFLRREDYVPVAQGKEREALARELAGKLAVSEISFGVWSSIQKFSPEHTVRDIALRISYNSERRVVIVERPGQYISPETHQRVHSRALVIIPVGDIEKVWATGRSILIRMACPVFYEYIHDTHIRSMCFDTAHQEIAPFTSSVILIQFPDALTYERFCARMSKASHFPDIHPRYFEVREQRVFDKRHLKSLQAWYRLVPLCIALQCEQAIHGGFISPLDLQALRESITAAWHESGASVVAAALQDIIISLGEQDSMRRRTGVEVLEQMFKEGKAKAIQAQKNMRALPDQDNFMCHQMYVTPTSYILEGPYPDRSNRVLRLYPNFHDHFLRVSFTEEGGQCRKLTKPFKSEFDYEDFIRTKIGGTLNNGFFLAGRHWEWLGYSQSALKDRQMIFMTPFVEEDKDNRFVDSNIIRTDIGVFTKVIMQPAKYGARIAQAFSATTASIVIDDGEIYEMDDITNPANGNCFTDGAGDMSIEMAEAIWAKINRRRLHNPQPPSAFQARFAGCKGVWMVNPTLRGKKLRFTPSQEKFLSESRTFDVANHSEKPGITFLNRPLVKLLEDLGISKETFLRIQDKAVHQAELAQTSYEQAAIHFAKNNLGMSFRLPALFDNLKTMLGIDFDSSPHGHIDFYKSVAMLGITSVLRDIKYRARIQVAGPTLIGVCDTWGLLEPDEIYVKVKGEQTSRILHGIVAVTRSPVIHPGDVQLARAVSVPHDHPIASLVNVVVFSSKGERSLPSMLGGGDLDGDLFNVLTDPDLIPEQTEAPGSYEPVTPHKLGRPSEMYDIAKFVCDYVIGDIVGQISRRHLMIADFSDLGVRDPQCLRLAELASQAVDFVKSGVPVSRKELPHPLRYTPDFMAREDETEKYLSTKALGEMFRAVRIQKYIRPKGETQNNVDASVLCKILKAVDTTYHQLPFGSWTPKRSAFVWKAYAMVFCSECEKIAYRNSLSRREDHRLGEEELAVGTTGSLRVESAEYDLMHRARTQMSDLTRKMRVHIKDLKEGDVDIDDESLEVEDDDEGNPVIVKKEEEQEDEGLLAKLASGAVTVAATASEEEQEDSEDEIKEIDSLLFYGEVDVKSSPSPSRGASDDEDDDEIREMARPDWRILASGRAYGACQYALDTLESQKVPFGMRLFSLVAVETLLSLIKTMR